jgi:RHS repeat-associated protein
MTKSSARRSHGRFGALQSLLGRWWQGLAGGGTSGQPQSQRFRPRLEVLEDRTLLSTVSWSNPLGGDWNVASNWSAGRLPGATDDVVINTAVSGPITYSTGTSTIHSLADTTASLIISGGSLSLTATSSDAKDFTVSGGTLAGSGNLTVTGMTTLTNGAMTGTGTTLAQGGLIISGNNTLDGRSLVNAGIATESPGQLHAIHGAVLTNQAGATWDLRGGDVIGGGAFNNAGMLTAENGGIFALNNLATGSVLAHSGTLYLSGGNSFGSFSVSAGATLNFSGANSLNAGSSVSGAGTVMFQPGTTTVRGAYDVSGQTWVNDGTVDFSSATPSITGTLKLRTGQLAGSGIVTVTGLTTWEAAIMTGTGTTVAQGGLAATGQYLPLIGRTLVNAGSATQLGSISLSGAIVTNQPGATWELQGNSAIIQASGTVGAFTNAGTLKQSAGSHSIGVAFNNASTGSVAVQAGDLSLTGGSSLGSFTVSLGATLKFLNSVYNFGPHSLVLGAGSVVFSGVGTTTTPQLIEVVSRDLGTVPAGFVNNGAYTTVSLDSGSYVKLVNDNHIPPGTGPEALYANTLSTVPGTTLNLNGLHLYTRAAQLTGTIINGPVGTLTSGGPLTIGNITPGLIATASNTDTWSFYGRAGGIISVVVNTNSGGAGTALSPTLNYAEVSLLDPAGHVLATGRNAQSGADVTLVGVSLPTDGTYSVRVHASPDFPTSAGYYLIKAMDASVFQVPLNLNQTISGVIDNPYRVDRWTFAATANTQVRFSLVNDSNPAIHFDLTGPNGYIGFQALTGSSGLLTLPADGTYTLTVSAATGATGNFAFRVDQTSVTDLTPGTVFTGNLVASGQAQLFRVNVPSANQLQILLQGSDARNHNELYVKYGAPPTRADYQYRFNNPASANQMVLVPSATAGPWYVLVYGESVPSAGPYTLTATLFSLFLSGATPDHYSNSADATLTISGSLFNSSTTVQLVAAGGAVYPASQVQVNVPTQMTAVFRAGSVPVGLYSVRVVQGNGDTANLSNAFQIVAGQPAQLTTNLVVPNDVGRHGVSTLYLEYQNTGDVAMPAPLLVVHGSDKALLGLDQTKIIQNFYSSAVPQGFSDTLQILGNGTTPGVLQPGEKIRMPIYYIGLLQPYDFSHTTVTFTSDSLTTDNATVIDWTSLNASLHPGSISAQAWEGIFPNLVALTGNTWGAYVTMLDNNASYLAKLGENVTDVGQLWNFQIERAIGFSTITHVGDTTDAQLAEPGLTLSLSRSFAPALTGRSEMGVLGRGWSVAGGWERTLRVGSDGTVVIADVDRSRRIFRPDIRGGYFSETGDYGVLTNLGGGVFSLRELDGLITGFRADGHVDYVQDTNGNRITAGFTGSLLTSLTHSSGDRLVLAYNPAGRLASVIDSVGRLTQYFYDASNEHLVRVVDPYNRTTLYTYDTGAAPATVNALLSIQHPDGSHDYFSYDGQGRFADHHQDNNAGQITFTYGPGGALTATDAVGAATTTYFDYHGLVAKVDDPFHNDTYLTYDSSFHLTQVMDAAGQVSNFSYDTNGNIVSSTDPLQHTTQFTYAGPFNRLTSVIDANGNAIRYGQDAQGNLHSTTYADGSVEFLDYDALGNPIRDTNRRGDPIQYTYDANGRIRTKTYSDGSQIVYNYDARGNLTSAVDASSITLLQYDANDRLMKITYPNSKFLNFTYDAAGRRTQMVDQDGFTTNYNYDAVGRLAMLTDAGGALIVRYTYDAAGRLSREDKGNGTYTTHDYDPAGQILHLINYAADATVNSRFDYTYDSLGRVMTMTTVDGAWTYTYDAIGELTHAVFGSTSQPSQDLQYFYDAVGNRTRTILNGVTTDYLSNNVNEYTQVGSAIYTYDLDGNLITQQTDSVTNTYAYSPDNRLVSATTPLGTWANQYDPFGNRIAATQNGQRTQYLIDPAGLGNMVGEYNGAGSLIADYTYGLGLTSRVDATGTAGFYDFNAVGSTVGVTNPGGRYLNSYSYLPFGESLTSSGPVPNKFQYVGQFGVMNDSNGLSFMRARFYASASGRFLSDDPLGPAGGLNLYGYTMNSPVKRIDPSGLAYASPYGPGSASTTVGVIGPYGFGGGGGVVAGSNGIGLTGQFCVGNPGASGAVTIYPNGVTDNFSLSANVTIFGLHISWPINVWKFKGNPGVGLGVPYLSGSLCLSYTTPPLWRFPPGGGRTSHTVASFDPNDLMGPAGFGTANFIAPGTVLPYRIDFENDAIATAPAQRADITNQVSPNLDWNTFALTEIGFGDKLIAVPAGTQHFQTSVPMTYNGRSFQVQIEAGIHSQTGQVYVTFQSLDPSTSLPPDVLTGFLPPEDGTGRGMGHFSYTILAKPGLPTGTQIRNIALVTFDLGETIATDQVAPHDPTQGTDPNKEALVTIDAGPPTSSVASLPATTTATPSTVSWSGSDDPGGSGIAFFDIYVSDNGGAFQSFLAHTTLTSAPFTGVNGHTYGFYSVSTDNVGHREATPAAAQATTRLQLLSTTTTIGSSAPTPVYGQAVTFTATVTSGGNPVTTGTVSFTEGSTVLGTGTLNSSGHASFTTSTLAVGNHSVTAGYAGGGNYSPSTSAPLLQSVNTDPTTTTLTSSANPSVFGQSVTFTARVTASSPGSGVPSGTVTFKDGSVTLGTAPVFSNNLATFYINALTVGNHSITASYASDGKYASSASAALTQTVNLDPTTTTLTSSVNPAVFGQSVTFTARVTASSPGSGVPSGTVTFKDGSVTLGTAPVFSNNLATFYISTLTVGNHSITASYASDGKYASSASAALTQTVNVDPTTTTLTSSVNPSVFGQNVTFTARVTASSPGSGVASGTVTFKDGSVTLGTATVLSNNLATFTTTALTVGTHSITASYASDGKYASSASTALTQTVNVDPTTTTLTSSVNPSVFGQNVTFTARVTANIPGTGVPSGTVTFKDGSITLGTGTVFSNGLATFTTRALTVGNHSITASYASDARYAGSVSTALTQTVHVDPTTTALTSVVSGGTVTFTATVIPISPGSGTPTGTVSFYDGSTLLGTITLDGSDHAHLTISTLSAGSHTITARYNGDLDFDLSTSTGLTQVIP